MRLPIFKTWMIMLSGIIMLSFSGCDSNGISYHPGGGDNTPPPVIKPTELVGVQVSPASTYVLVGQSEQFTATAVFSDGTTEDVTTTAIWNISDKSIAVINDKGTATGVSAGSVTLAATYVSGGIEQTGAAKLDVLAAEPTFVSLTIEGNDIVLKGGTTQLNAIATLSDGTTYKVNDKVNWTAIPSKYTTIDAMGVVSGIDTGVALITATAKSDNTINAHHDMSVTDIDLQLQSIEIRNIAGDVITSLNVNITTEEYVEAWGIYSDGSKHNINADVVWWSEDQKIASINYIKSSYVYGRDLGDTIVKAHFGGVEGSVNVMVVNTGPALTNIILKTTDGIDVTGGTIDPIPAGFKTWVTAYGSYDGGTTYVDINRHVAFTSDKPEVAYVIDAIDSNIRGRSEGSAVITAEWQGVSASVTAPVIGLTSIVIKTGEGATTPPPNTIIDIANPLTMSTGLLNRVHITAHGMYTDGQERYINTAVFWKSDNNDVASMSLLQLNSWVTGKSAGTTQVSAKLGGVEGRATVIVE